MKLKPYPSYKDSGVEWLGALPNHWSIVTCRGFVTERTLKNETGENENYLSLMANVGIILYEEKGDVGNKKPDDLTKCKLVFKGDFVINSMNYGIGSYGLSPYDGICSPVYIVLKPKNEVVKTGFATRVFENKAFQTYAQSFGNGILDHRAAINWDIMKGIPVGIPPIDEQSKVLTFLDRETVKLDTLIAKQEKLIELLQEKRQAIISHAVTKGLNPDTKMKDSGVEWLGMIPEGWNATRLSRVLVAIKDGTHGSFVRLSDGRPLLSAKNVMNGKMAISDNESFISEEDYSSIINSGFPRYNDLLLTIVGTIGRSCLYKLDEPYAFQRSVAFLRFSKVNHPEFFYYVTQSKFFLEQMISKSKASAQMGVYMGDVVACEICWPQNIGEQIEIANYLDNETSKIDALIEKAKHSIELAKEHRTALISAAVTGKIDLRETN